MVSIGGGVMSLFVCGGTLEVFAGGLTQGVSADWGAGMLAMHWRGVDAPLGCAGTSEVFAGKGTQGVFAR